MVKNFKNSVVLLAVVSFAFVASGCVGLAIGAAAGAGGYAWVSGVLDKDFMISAEKLQSATVRGFQDLGMDLSEQKEDRLSAAYRSKFADGQSVKVDIKALTERSAKIRIRVGVFGNHSRSEMILNAIEKHL